MARRSNATEQAAELDDFLEHLPPQPPPKNLGNIPDEVVSAQTPTRADGTEPDVRRADEPPQRDLPLDVPAPESPATAAAETDEGEPEGPSEADRLAELEARLANVQRENEFYRRGYQAAQPSAPEPPQLTPESILPFDVTEEDLQGILQGSPKSAQMIRDALRATAYSGALAAIQYLTHAYQTTRTQETTAEQLRQSFYAQHPDLQSYPEVVLGAAQQVVQQYPHADAQALIVATGQRARARLREMGVSPSASSGPVAPSPARSPRARAVRPAQAEMGNSGRGNGSIRLTPVERDILDLYHSR